MRKDLERKADWIALKAFSLGKSLFTGNPKSFFVQQKSFLN
uniref:Ribosomal protein L32 n=1 Tax=Stapeliopsis breviloba TaxID=307701 RepID=A0A059XNF7_9GENT|nr:ribosomal protein L32 [Stapeliopsis breviloba]